MPKLRNLVAVVAGASTLGGAAISDKHANFIVNAGDARAADIEALIEIAHVAVKQKFGIDLVREVRIIGEPE